MEIRRKNDADVLEKRCRSFEKTIGIVFFTLCDAAFFLILLL